MKLAEQSGERVLHAGDNDRPEQRSRRDRSRRVIRRARRSANRRSRLRANMSHRGGLVERRSLRPNCAKGPSKTARDRDIDPHRCSGLLCGQHIFISALAREALSRSRPARGIIPRCLALVADHACLPVKAAVIGPSLTVIWPCHRSPCEVVSPGMQGATRRRRPGSPYLPLRPRSRRTGGVRYFPFFRPVGFAERRARVAPDRGCGRRSSCRRPVRHAAIRPAQRLRRA